MSADVVPSDKSLGYYRASLLDYCAPFHPPRPRGTTRHSGRRTRTARSVVECGGKSDATPPLDG